MVADDAASGGKLRDIRSRWEKLIIHGPRFGYFPNAAKTFLLVKSPKLAEAEEVFFLKQEYTSLTKVDAT